MKEGKIKKERNSPWNNNIKIKTMTTTIMMDKSQIIIINHIWISHTITMIKHKCQITWTWTIQLINRWIPQWIQLQLNQITKLFGLLLDKMDIIIMNIVTGTHLHVINKILQ